MIGRQYGNIARMSIGCDTIRMEMSRSPHRQRVARLRAAGLTVREIARAVGISHQRVSQILATEPVPVWHQATVEIVDGKVVTASDAEPRVIHALITNALKRHGKIVVTPWPKAGY